MADNWLSNLKIFRHPDRLAMWQRGELPPPVTAEFDLTSACNHCCPACGGGDYRGHVQPDNARDWLSQLACIGVRGVLFTGGGEPLMHPAAVDLIECASALGLRVGLMTNGSLLTPDFAARLVVACDWVRVSIDTKETHGISDEEHAAAWEAVLALAGAKRRQHTTCTVGVSYMVDASTRGGMAAAARQAKHAGADYLEFRPFWGRAAEAAVDLKETWGLAGDGFRVLYARQFTAASREYTTCHGSAFTTVIQADGHVPLCCNLRGKPDWYLGSLHAEPFAQIWTTARRAGVLSRPAPCFPGCRHDALNGMLDLLIGPCEHASFL